MWGTFRPAFWPISSNQGTETGLLGSSRSGLADICGFLLTAEADLRTAAGDSAADKRDARITSRIQRYRQIGFTRNVQRTSCRLTKKPQSWRYNQDRGFVRRS